MSICCRKIYIIAHQVVCENQNLLLLSKSPISASVRIGEVTDPSARRCVTFSNSDEQILEYLLLVFEECIVLFTDAYCIVHFKIRLLT